MEKVVELLTQLDKKLEQEGKDEATAYDKYACFCKEQSDDKQYAIERSVEKIKTLTDKIGELDTKISEADVTISSLATQISNLETTITTEAGNRTREHAAFLSSQADVDNAIDAVERAILAMKESKTAMSGKAELESLSQMRSVASQALGSAAHLALSEGDRVRLQSLASVEEPGKAYTSKYHSNEIIETLQNLLITFRRRKTSIEEQEFSTQTQHELRQQSLANEKKFAEKEKREVEEQREAWASEKAAKESDRTQETNDKNADVNFLGMLQQKCEDTSRFWDQRSSRRANELTAISNALTELKKGVAPNWQANKKLVGVQQKSVVKANWVHVRDIASPSASRTEKHASMSFLQIRGTNLRGATALVVEKQAAEKAKQFLMRSAAHLHSSLLSVMALRVQVSEDHFVKVRQLIKDLITRLEGDATSEAQQKSLCDTGVATATANRDESQNRVEDFTAQISTKNAEKAKLLQEIAELSAQISANTKAINEATILRDDERKENGKTVTDASEGKQAVENAIQILKTFYRMTLVQVKRSEYVPPNSDREGLTVSDRDPEIFDTMYSGATESATGIVGMLEVILSDFDRTGTAVSAQEQTAENDYQSFTSTTNQDSATKQNSVDSKNQQITAIDAALTGLEQNKADAVTDHANAGAELEGLHSMCVAGEETWEERRDARLKEVEALKEAHDILENWSK